MFPSGAEIVEKSTEALRKYYRPMKKMKRVSKMFNEDKFLEGLEIFGYEYELEHDADTGELLYVNIKPKYRSGLIDSYRVEFDVINFMYENGFMVDQVIFEDAITGNFVSFYRERDRK